MHAAPDRAIYATRGHFFEFWPTFQSLYRHRCASQNGVVSMLWHLRESFYMILIVSERKIGKKKFWLKKMKFCENQWFSVFLRQNTPKMTKKVVKLFFRQPLKNFLLVRWPCSRYLKGVFLVVLYAGKKLWSLVS